VIDTGIGISQDGVKKLFKPFSQADKSIQTKYGGTGLGLWISNKLVGLMRGKISVVSELNKGTVFIIEIPVVSEVMLSINSD
jgi:signal transduction histidine kinase